MTSVKLVHPITCIRWALRAGFCAVICSSVLRWACTSTFPVHTNQYRPVL